MSDVTKIEWTDYTWSPWEGCTKISPGCVNCYAETRNHRFGMDNWGKGKPRRLTVDWKKPLRWDGLIAVRKENFAQQNLRVFPSLCDWLDDEVPIQWLSDFMGLMLATPNLDWLLLTKRPENFFRVQHCLDDERAAMWFKEGSPPRNIWIGVSVEDQQRADERIPGLLKIPAAVRFLSVEPLLGPVQLEALRINTLMPGAPGIDWVIIGGESGAGARPCNIEWLRLCIRQCRAAGVPVFVKQLGSNPVSNRGPQRIKLRHNKGGDPFEWPEDLQVREFPS